MELKIGIPIRDPNSPKRPKRPSAPACCGSHSPDPCPSTRWSCRSADRWWAARPTSAPGLSLRHLLEDQKGRWICHGWWPKGFFAAHPTWGVVKICYIQTIFTQSSGKWIMHDYAIWNGPNWFGNQRWEWKITRLYPCRIIYAFMLFSWQIWICHFQVRTHNNSHFFAQWNCFEIDLQESMVEYGCDPRISGFIIAR